MNTKKLLCALTLAAASFAAAGAQTGRPADGARLIDSFGNIQVSDYLARLDSLAIDLQNAPGARAFIVAYIVPNEFPGWPLRRIQWARGYLVNGRGIDPSRVEVVNAGYADAIKFEFWLVVPGGNAPRADFDLGAALARERTPFLFDRYRYFKLTPEAKEIDYGYIGYLDERGLYEPFVTALRSDPGARGCVIAYAAPRQKRGADRRLASLVKREIMRAHPVAAERVVAVGGGRAKERFVEFWIVPPGSPLPKPSLAARPARRKRR